MNLSLIISSRNRSSQLLTMLSRLDLATMQRLSVELVLVDSASEDNTLSVMKAFASLAGIPVRVCIAPRNGLGLARNVGIAEATGDLLCFTDDDCYLGMGYFEGLLKSLAGGQYQYGMGAIIPYDPLDDERVACARIDDETIIPPGSILPTGAFQGANMFFKKEVFATVGPFRSDMGAGTPFACEDIEMGLRASQGGFTGVLLPSVQVFHHHGRRKNSAEALATITEYDRGRGAYYACALAAGIPQFWHLWQLNFQTSGAMPVTAIRRLERELRGAADYLAHLSEQAEIGN